jgi:hypothetical protein
VLIPAGGLLHPAPLAAIALLVINDHLLKPAVPGWWTGKLSDFAGMVFFPLLLQASGETLLWALRRPWGPSRRVLGISVLATGLGFAGVQLVPGVQALWSWGLGALQWPLRALMASAGGRAAPDVLPTASTADPTDLLALLFLGVAWQVGQHRLRRD